MKYENAKDVLPPDLLREVQKYCAGRLLYIPTGTEKRSWGEASGYREKLNKRNHMICNRYNNGSTISELADTYFLSIDSIKKIIYSKKKNHGLIYQPNLRSAIAYASEGMLEQWVHSYSLFTLKDEKLLRDYESGKVVYFGVVKLPLRLIRNSEDAMRSSKIAKGCPLIVGYKDRKLTLMASVDQFNDLKKEQLNAFPSIVLIREEDDYNHFMNNYGKHFLYVE